MQPHISIKAEDLFEIGGFTITNSMVLSFVVLIFFVGLAYAYRNELLKTTKSVLFYPFHALINAVYELFASILKEKTALFFPFVGSLFFFILFNNWFGLLPGVGSIVLDYQVAAEYANEIEYIEEKVEKEGYKPHDIPLFRAGTADLNTTLGLAILAFLVIQYYSLAYLGPVGFIQRFFASLNPINLIVGILEVVSELSKVVSLSFRLFGNILAGEILLVIIAFLIPYAASFPFFLFEIFVGIMQALVFSILTAIFLATATEKAHH